VLCSSTAQHVEKGWGKTDIYDQKKEIDDENENGTFCTNDSVFASIWLFPYA
jgi:hypothetical protein